MKNVVYVRYKVGEIMDKNDGLGILGFCFFAIGTYTIHPAIMFITCGLICMGLAIFGARKGVNRE